MSSKHPRVPFLDLAAINNRHLDELGRAAVSTIETGRLVLGAQVESFEGEFAVHCKAKYCVGVASGLDALVLLLRAHIELGRLNHGDEVIVPANTYIATVLAISHCGLEPVPAEPLEATFNLDAEGVKRAAEGRSKVRAIMAVHLYGQKAPMDHLAGLCRERGWLLLADAAQAAGIKPAAVHGAAFSFYPGKNLGALGDGGAVAVDDEDVAETIRTLRNYGSREKYLNDYIGVNSRLDEIQAAMLRVKLPRLAADNEKRRQIAAEYCARIASADVILPRLPEKQEEHVWHLFVVRCANRDALREHLHGRGIETIIHYPVPPHRQKAYRGTPLSGHALPVAEKLADEVVSLPISPVQTKEQTLQVIDAVNAFAG